MAQGPSRRLTGRPIDAQEALTFGLASVVPEGKAREAAEQLAHELARFAQTCLQADRHSSYRQWGDTIENARRFEGREGKRPLVEEAGSRVQRFADGSGRGDTFSHSA
jgi:enoyl-CoA hydratase